VAERDVLRLHIEDPELFRAAVAFTAAETQFTSRLVEKDYFCSVILRHLAAADAGLVFRGGTCLAKVHAGLYRLSEDLDFLIPTPVDASRGERRRRATESRRATTAIDEALPGIRVTTPFTGANDSRQYAAAVSYQSLVSQGAETIKVEVGLREPLLTEVVEGAARTLLLDPISSKALVGSFRLPCLGRQEAMAEKLRAALSRREVAIRDFFDVDHAVRVLRMRLKDDDMVELVKGKLATPGNSAVDVTEGRLVALRQQVEAELRPVLREVDFVAFDLERAFAIVADLAGRLGGEG
jgi:predicted nucleotidyltransferase component of viral defense system